jgi:hypothetical protein
MHVCHPHPQYSMSIVVTLFGLLHPTYTKTSVEESWSRHRTVWLCFSIVAVLYTFVWDVTMDWGLMVHRPNESEEDSGILKRRLLFAPRGWLYFAAIAIDLALRFSWIMTLLPISFNPYSGTVINLQYYDDMCVIGERCSRESERTVKQRPTEREGCVGEDEERRGGGGGG